MACTDLDRQYGARLQQKLQREFQAFAGTYIPASMGKVQYGMGECSEICLSTMFRGWLIDWSNIIRSGIVRYSLLCCPQ